MARSIRSEGLSHVAMSVADGTLTAAFRAEVLAFYGVHLGWREIESLRLPDRMTLDVGGRDYVNVRERAEPMVVSGYEHVGVLLPSTAAVEQLWSSLDGAGVDVHLEPLTTRQDGYASFRFRHLLPLAIEIQHFPG